MIFREEGLPARVRNPEAPGKPEKPGGQETCALTLLYLFIRSIIKNWRNIFIIHIVSMVTTGNVSRNSMVVSSMVVSSMKLVFNPL